MRKRFSTPVTGIVIKSDWRLDEKLIGGKFMRVISASLTPSFERGLYSPIMPSVTIIIFDSNYPIFNFLYLTFIFH